MACGHLRIPHLTPARWRGQQAPSAPTPDRYRDHWSKAGWSGVVWEADLDPSRGPASAVRLLRWLVTVS